MYEFRGEATRALKPESTRPVKESVPQEAWTFKHLAVSRSAGLTHVQFQNEQTFGEETVNELREDFSHLADKLVRDSKVLLDFVGVKSFSIASIDALILFNRKLRTKGSRVALCCLDADVHQAFFGKEQGTHEK